MKPVIIIVIAFVLLIPVSAFAETFEIKILAGSSNQECQVTDSCLSPSTITIHQGDEIEFIPELDIAYSFGFGPSPDRTWGMPNGKLDYGVGTYYYYEYSMPWIRGTVNIVPETTNKQLGNYLNVEKFEKVGDYIFLKVNGHMDTPVARIDIRDHNGASTGSEGYGLENFIDDDGFFSIDSGWNSCWGSCEHTYYDGIYKIVLIYFDEYTKKNTIAQEASAKLNILPEGKTVHEIQLLDGSMENKCNDKCVDPETTHIKRGDYIKFVHNDCEGCHFMRILANEKEKTPGFEYYPFENGKTRWMFEETRTFTDIEHPWIKGNFIVSSETPNIPTEDKISKYLEVNEQKITPLEDKGLDDNALSGSDSNSRMEIASFVDKSKSPQHYIDRYNNEPTYKKWFDTNFPEYDSIQQAVGLELTEKIPNWVKNIFGWYAQDQVSEDELLNAIKYLIDEGILVVG